MSKENIINAAVSYMMEIANDAAQVRCSQQTEGALYFTCEELPATNLTANVLMRM